MWLLPPDFPADTFDLSPGTWALPWYADDRHVASLMQLLMAGEARIREWVPLPWAALEEEIDAPVRSGTALVLYAPAKLSTDEIVSRARKLPWPYVFWWSPRPVLEGEGAWLEREVKQSLLSELHRGLLDPAHPLARYHVERLPLELIASMVADPVDLLEIAEAAVRHRLEHVEDGLQREEYEHSTRWVAGRRLGDYLLRIPSDDRAIAMSIVRRGGRGEEDRASFRRAALAIQDVGLGLLVGEDLALGPLARHGGDVVVWAGALDRVPHSALVVSSTWKTTPAHEEGPLTRVTLPPVGILSGHHPYEWVVGLGHRDDASPWAHVLGHIFIALEYPSNPSNFPPTKRLLSASTPAEHRDHRIHELFQLFIDFIDPNNEEERAANDLAMVRSRAAALRQAIARNDAERATTEHLDCLLVEHVIVRRPTQAGLDAIIDEALSRPRAAPSPSAWLDATWASLGAEALRRRGRSKAAQLQFSRASHFWASLDPIEFREAWLHSRMSEACAAFDLGELDQSEQILDLIANEVEEYSYDTPYAMLPLLRGLITIRRKKTPEDARASLDLAITRYRKLHDKQGEAFAISTLYEHGLAGEVVATSLERIEDELEQIHDSAGLTHTSLVIGDIALSRSEIEAARMRYRRAEALASKTGDDLARSTALHKLAHLEAQVRRHEVALSLERQALEIETMADQLEMAVHTTRTIVELELRAASASVAG